MSDQNGDLFGITEFFPLVVSINWFKMNMLRRNNWFNGQSTIVNEHENLNSCLSTTIRQDQCSSDSKYNNAYHCYLFTILFSKFHQKNGQVIKTKDQFNVNMIAALWHIINITITKYLFGSRHCIIVCYVLYTYYTWLVVFILLLLHILLLGCQQ